MRTTLHTQGVLAQRRRYGETSLVLVWITPDYGVCRMMAKGALRPKKSFPGIPDLFYRCEISFHPGLQSELGQLIEWQTLHAHVGLRRALVQIQAAQYAAELILALEPSGGPMPEVFALLVQALDWLESHSVTPRLLERFETRLADFTGFGGDLTAALRHYHQPVPALRQVLSRTFAAQLSR